MVDCSSPQYNDRSVFSVYPACGEAEQSEKSFNKLLGSRLKALRLDRMMTLDDTVAGTPLSAIKLRNYENGQSPVSVFHLLQILDALDMPATRFFKDDEPQDSISVEGIPTTDIRTLRALIRRMRKGHVDL
jgi:transcriptional regulator with XRE-family HTH domain